MLFFIWYKLKKVCIFTKTKTNIMTYTYQSYKKGEKVYQQESTGEQGEFLGLVSRQTKYSFFYIDERGRERMKYRNILA